MLSTSSAHPHARVSSWLWLASAFAKQVDAAAVAAFWHVVNSAGFAHPADVRVMAAWTRLGATRRRESILGAMSRPVGTVYAWARVESVG
jgi:hypothetical protein